MTTLAEQVMRRVYPHARRAPERLPWHREAPSSVLDSAVKARDRHGLALDVGCGAGVFSVWLAEQGMDVTGLDLFPEAIAMAKKRAADEGVAVAFVCGDLFAYVPESPFDLVFDSGCPAFARRRQHRGLPGAAPPLAGARRRFRSRARGQAPSARLAPGRPEATLAGHDPTGVRPRPPTRGHARERLPGTAAVRSDGPCRGIPLPPPDHGLGHAAVVVTGHRAALEPSASTPAAEPS